MTKEEFELKKKLRNIKKGKRANLIETIKGVAYDFRKKRYEYLKETDSLYNSRGKVEYDRDYKRTMDTEISTKAVTGSLVFGVLTLAYWITFDFELGFAMWLLTVVSCAILPYVVHMFSTVLSKVERW